MVQRKDAREILEEKRRARDATRAPAAAPAQARPPPAAAKPQPDPEPMVSLLHIFPSASFQGCHMGVL